MSNFVPKLERPDRRGSKWSSSRTGLALFMFLAFAIASCGSSVEVDSTSGSSADDVADSDAAAADSTPEGDASAEQSAPAESESAEAATDSLGSFPALNVANVSNGEIVNLQQELSGGESPILLWFYAPH